MATLKLPQEARDRIAAAVAPVDTAEARNAYREGRFPRADRVKDLDMRYRWDVLRAAIGTSGICDLYRTHDVNDNHIDSALRRIVPPLGD